ncbi:putative aldo-keto reductase [Leptodontidium sp. MPI-SDFR-AT-0119]|nr:putative aldo-keto reductase [Leptodontidium sp. MPI-SDFR-AT-0119]
MGKAERSLNGMSGMSPLTRLHRDLTYDQLVNCSQTLHVDLLALPNSSVKIPRLGFGVHQSPSKQFVASCLAAAFKAGYRHIDPAQYYDNEKEVREALRQLGMPRSDVVDRTYEKLVESVDKINVKDEYVDPISIHTPSGGSKNRKEMFLALEKLLKRGRTKAIGVSNWGIGHIEELKGFAKVYPPHVNQIELPFSRQREIVEFCHRNGIIIEAYCPLAHKKTLSHVLIRYCLQKNWVLLPKSDTPSRIVESATVDDFELSKEEMKTLDDLNQGSKKAIVKPVSNTL